MEQAWSILLSDRINKGLKHKTSQPQRHEYFTQQIKLLTSFVYTLKR